MEYLIYLINYFFIEISIIYQFIYYNFYLFSCMYKDSSVFYLSEIRFIIFSNLEFSNILL